MGKVSKKAGFSFLFFALLFFGVLASAGIWECEDETGSSKYDCIERNAQYAWECDDIPFSTQQERCILRVAEKPADCELISDDLQEWNCIKKLFPGLGSLGDCAKVPYKYLSRCEAFVTFQNNSEDISACWDLKYGSQGYCVEDHVRNRKISDPNFCLDAKEDFQERCAYLATSNKYGLGGLLGGAEEGACDSYEGKIKAGCEQYLSFMGAARGTASWFVLVWVALFAFVVVTALVAIIRRRARKKEEPEAIIKKFPETFK
jgi:hypothetical protein